MIYKIYNLYDNLSTIYNLIAQNSFCRETSLSVFTLLAWSGPSLGLAALLGPDSAQPLVANQEVARVRMRGHQLEARLRSPAPPVSWSRCVRSPRLCLSCVIIPSQLPPVATGPGAPWPQSSVQPRPRSRSHHTSGQQHQGGGHHRGQPPGGDNLARGHGGHRRGPPWPGGGLTCPGGGHWWPVRGGDTWAQGVIWGRGPGLVLVSVESPFPPDILIICSQRTNSVRGESNLCDGNDLMTQQRLGPALAECESPSSNNLSQLSVRKTSQVAIFPFPFSRSVQSLCTMSVSGL